MAAALPSAALPNLPLPNLPLVLPVAVLAPRERLSVVPVQVVVPPLALLSVVLPLAVTLSIENKFKFISEIHEYFKKQNNFYICYNKYIYHRVYTSGVLGHFLPLLLYED
jgi:hypothetical protein